MRYVIMACASLAACMALGWALASLLARKGGRMWFLPMRMALALACDTLLIGLLALAYLGNYYHASGRALRACEGSALVSVCKGHGSLLFDGPGADTALIFLPGAKVQAQAYAPLMLSLAEQGIDCYLMDPPANIAFLAGSDVSDIMEDEEYRHLLVGGHSLGGVMAAGCAGEHADKVDALVLLASYPTRELPASMALLSIYGSEDGCLEFDQYESSRAIWPANCQELVIEGGNHAGFGDYGTQRGDGEARIGADEQQKLTVEAVLELARHIEEGS